MRKLNRNEMIYKKKLKFFIQNKENGIRKNNEMTLLKMVNLTFSSLSSIREETLNSCHPSAMAVIRYIYPYISSIQ